MANLYNVPLQNSIQRVLANTLTSGETSTITFSVSVSAVLQASATIPGILVVDRIDSNGNLTPNNVEYISFTGVSGSTVTGLVRGLAGTSAIGHSIGAIVEFVPDVVWADSLNDVITTQHNADGTHKTLSEISLVSVTINNVNLAGNSLVSLNLTTSVLNNNTLTNGSLASVTIQNYVSGGNTQKLTSISTASTTINIDLSLGNVFEVIMNSSKTITFNNAQSNASLQQYFMLRMHYASLYSGTFSNTIRWPQNSAPIQTSTAGRADEFGFKALSSSIFEGFIVGQNYYD